MQATEATAKGAPILELRPKAATLSVCHSQPQCCAYCMRVDVKLEDILPKSLARHSALWDKPTDKVICACGVTFCSQQCRMDAFAGGAALIAG